MIMMLEYVKFGLKRCFEYWIQNYLMRKFQEEIGD